MQQETRGRKPIEDSLKKISIQMYLERYKIDKLGGKEKIKNMIYDYITNKINENEKK